MTNFDPDTARNAAIVLLSGGQDSATCLAWALRRFHRVRAVAFDYGQRHDIELAAAKAIADACKVQLEVIPVPGLRGSSLTDHSLPVDDDGGMHGLPSTFTPGRNLVFLALAVGAAVEFGAGSLVTGICQADSSGYPDCREPFRDAMQDTINEALGIDWFEIHAPLMKLTKAESVALAVELDALPLLAMSHTCYLGRRPACGTCPACKLRRRGFRKAGVEDPIKYRNDPGGS